MKENVKTVLALSIGTKGVGYAVFEGQQHLMDWGLCYTKKYPASGYGLRIDKLLSFYNPDVIVLNTSVGSARLKKLHTVLLQQMPERDVVTFSRDDIRCVFSLFGSRTKYEIAVTLGSWFGETMTLTPRRRAIWESEDPKMGIFDAISLGLTYFYNED